MRAYRPKIKRTRGALNFHQLVSRLHEKCGYSPSYLRAQTLKKLVQLNNRIGRRSGLAVKGPLTIDRHYVRISP